MTRRPVNLSLYLVTDTGLCGPRGVPATVQAAVAGGVTVVQLRDPGATDAHFVALGVAVREVLAGTGVPLIIDDRVHLVQDIGADGVHVGQRDMPPAQARQLLGPDAMVGLSVSTIEQVRTARGLGDGVLDYLGVGPVWPTATKPDHGTPIGPGGVAAVAAASPWPVVAIGGITTKRTGMLRHSGAADVAVVSTVCAAEEPAVAAASLRAAWDGQP
ncbi:thiamine phosphate synthase [Brachybacterium muris]|uniref:Thiamine-phosphate synthase n=1 Tax=Brachybacterium muris UCD-AY4 TaxID=1249481 RepID=A0A022KV65_9MICO|nr:thiamine phosphate synthase [Brachybacterium muris]EYT47798.1 thiamine-phosphate synthase [Brachybacterium muris UCD-AY4]